MRLGLKIPYDPNNPEHKDPTKYKLNPGDVLEHTILVMEKLAGERLEVQLAGMFHDVGKPVTLKFDNGRPTNKGHDAIGADMVEQIMLRLKFSTDEIDLVKNLVADHMRHHVIKEFRKSTLKRYLALPYIDDLMLLNEADTRSASGNMEHIDYLREKMDEWEPEEIRPKKIFTGKDLIEMKFIPGPIFKKILNKIEDLQLEGIITNKKQAIKFVEANY